MISSEYSCRHDNIGIIMWRHFRIIQQAGITDNFLSKAVAQVFNGFVQRFCFRNFDWIGKQVELTRGVQRCEIDGSDRNRADRMGPVIAARKQGEGFLRNNRWTLCGNGESTLPLLRKKVFISNRNCDASGHFGTYK